MTIQATITKVDLPRIGTDQKRYHFVCFKHDDGRHFISYISPDMANFHRWKDKLKVGAVLKNLMVLPDQKTIDADSYPVRVPTLEQPTLL